jgi:hypothetical protein
MNIISHTDIGKAPFGVLTTTGQSTATRSKTHEAERVAEKPEL